MAAIPTEVLNEDIKDLRGDIREVRQKIDLVKDDIQRVALVQADSKGEFRLVKFLLTVVILGIAGSAWQFFNLNSRVNGVELRLDKVDFRLDKIDSRLDKMDSRLDKLDSRLERFETSVLKILEQPRPATAIPPSSRP